MFFILAEKKEERDKHDKQKHKSNSITSSNNQTHLNDDEPFIRASIHINGDTSSSNSVMEDTWIHDLFQGTLVSTTKCLNCETVSL